MGTEQLQTLLFDILELTTVSFDLIRQTLMVKSNDERLAILKRLEDQGQYQKLISVKIMALAATPTAAK